MNCHLYPNDQIPLRNERTINLPITNIHISYKLALYSVPRLFIHANAPTHITMDINDPAGAANPIGNRVSGYMTDARYDPGILAHTMCYHIVNKPYIGFAIGTEISGEAEVDSC